MGTTRYEAFDIVNQEGNHLQGKTVEGKVREFCLQIVRDTVTNELTIKPYRHYTDDVDFIPWFPGSEAWTEDERRGDTD
jgi:hypothetical protein